jgi:uncharacterized protein (TIGR00730 family)
MKSICVYCGSSPGLRKEYQTAAAQLGEMLAHRKITMVYGGGNVGLMGIAADAALSAGGTVIGVMPEALVRKEVAHRGLTELRVVKSMHERKLAMAELSEGFVALPGGIGTAEEILEAFTSAQLGIHIKPCGLLNVAGFFEGFRIQLDRMVRDRFLREEQLNQLIVESQVEDLVGRLISFEPFIVEKWLDRNKLVV